MTAEASMPAMLSAHASTFARSSLRRWLEVLAFLGLWMALGWRFKLSPNAYPVLGVPLTFAFQGLVRTTPLRAAWVWRREPLTMPAAGWFIAVVLVAMPFMDLALELDRGMLAPALWSLAAVAGAFAAAFSATRLRRADVVPLITTFIVTIALSRLFSELGHLVTGSVAKTRWHVGEGVGSFARYLPASFFIEEVTFRGVLDPHVSSPRDRGGWANAALLSALWGLWHWPIHPSMPVSVVLSVILTHSIMGSALTWGMRKTGNLFVPVLAHAAIDAIRNAGRG